MSITAEGREAPPESWTREEYFPLVYQLWKSFREYEPRFVPEIRKVITAIRERANMIDTGVSGWRPFLRSQADALEKAISKEGKQ